MNYPLIVKLFNWVPSGGLWEACVQQPLTLIERHFWDFIYYLEKQSHGWGEVCPLKTHQYREVVFTPSPSHLLIKKPHSRFSIRKNGRRIDERGLKFSTKNNSHAFNEALSKINSPYIYIHIQCASLPYIYKKIRLRNNSKGRVKRKGNSAKSISHLPSHHWGHLQCTVPLSFQLKGRKEKDRGTVSAKNDLEFPYRKMFTTLKFQWIPHRHNMSIIKMIMEKNVSCEGARMHW